MIQRQPILEIAPGTATVSDMAAIHAERISSPALVFRDALAKVTPRDEPARKALALLREWDGSMDRDLVPPSIYAATRAHITRDMVGYLLGALGEDALANVAGAEALVRQINARIVTAIDNRDNSMLPPDHEWPGMLRSALERGVAELRERLGEEMATWQWGRIHRTQPRHPLSAMYPELAELLDPPPLPTHGDADTPLAGGYALSEPFIATGMSVNRYIHDPSDWTNSRWIVPLGASGHPGSPHYADQAEMWSNVEYVPQLWDASDIEREAETHQRLEPA